MMEYGPTIGMLEYWKIGILGLKANKNLFIQHPPIGLFQILFPNIPTFQYSN